LPVLSTMTVRRRHMLGLLAAAPAALARPASAQSVKIRLAVVPTDSYGEPYYALDGGFFAKAGLDVDLQTFNTGSAITNALAGGALEAGIADPIQVGDAFNRGVPFGFFAGGMLYSTNEPTTALCVVKNGPVKSAKDLAGQTLGVFGLGSMAEFATRAWLDANGVDSAAVKFVEIPPSAMVPAIARGTVPAGVVSEPTLSSAGASGVVPFATVYDYCAKTFYINSWFANRTWIAQNRETVRKLVGAIYEAARWANTHRPETLAILAKYGKLDVAKAANMHRAVYDTSLDPKKLRPPLDIAWKFGALRTQLTAADLIVKV
jgi:NitT/TauT family transport system substrate-binding protein